METQKNQQGYSLGSWSMKYMGSKRHLLDNGLGKRIKQECSNSSRFVDLFAGSASVSWFAAINTNAEVISVDLQSYTSILANSVLKRHETKDYGSHLKKWIEDSKKIMIEDSKWKLLQIVDSDLKDLTNSVAFARALCQSESEHGPVWKAYGGHYFSPLQALKIDIMRANLPEEEPARTIALAALISAASDCAASPGHTAQPLQPTASGLKHIIVAWSKDPFVYAESAYKEISSKVSRKIGNSYICDALEFANTLGKNDIVFLDPPYSDVHYSRFYHVLETITKGYCGEVTGVGRYPPVQERPGSDFSRKGQAKKAMENLIQSIAVAGSKAIITYPNRMCSNNLSADLIKSIANQWFEIDTYLVDKKFSTLGGNSAGSRPARQQTNEAILTLYPK